jgi:hypothetical protein
VKDAGQVKDVEEISARVARGEIRAVVKKAKKNDKHEDHKGSRS